MSAKTTPGAFPRSSSKSIPVFRAERLRHLVGHHPHAGIDEADIAPRPAEADLDGLEHGDLGSSLTKMKSGREPRVASPDDGDIDRHVLGQWAGLRRRGRRLFPKAMGSGVVSHHIASSTSKRAAPPDGRLQLTSIRMPS